MLFDMGYIDLSILEKLSFEEFYNKKIVIHRIALFRDGGVLIAKWLIENEHLILKTSKSSSKSRWGVDRSYFRDTAFFSLESQSSDGCPDGCLITPIYKIPPSLTTEQINQTPTLLELFFGIMKKYPEQVHHIHAQIKDDLDDIEYLEWMHPKSLIE